MVSTGGGPALSGGPDSILVGVVLLIVVAVVFWKLMS